MRSMHATAQDELQCVSCAAATARHCTGQTSTRQLCRGHHANDCMQHVTTTMKASDHAVPSEMTHYGSMHTHCMQRVDESERAFHRSLYSTEKRRLWPHFVRASGAEQRGRARRWQTTGCGSTSHAMQHHLCEGGRQQFGPCRVRQALIAEPQASCRRSCCARPHGRQERR
jgi:hypothetical protein